MQSEVVFINKTRRLLSNNITYWRLERNWSQEEFTFKLKSSTQYVSDMERGKRNISTDFVDSIANTLMIEPHELFIERPIIKNRRVDLK